MKEKISLLLELDEGDYQAVIDELTGIQQGVDYHYVIDTYDLIEYCYPFGIKKEDEDAYDYLNKGVEYVADEQFALYRLFTNKQERVILLDEYIPELINFKRFIEYAIKNSIEIVDTFKRYKEEYFNRGALRDQNLSKLQGIFNTKLILIFSISVDFLHKGIDKLAEVFRERQILISMEEYENLGYEGILGAAFDRNRGTEFGIKALAELNRRSPIEDDDPEKVENRKAARDRDVKVIDRIFSINNYLEKAFLEKKKLGKRVVLLYLSSTNGSRMIFESNFVRNSFPVINGKRMNPLRNRAQLFLKSLCMQTDSLEEAKKNVEYLRGRLLQIRQYQDRIQEETLRADISELLAKKFNYYRENFENFTVLNQYDQIRKLVTETLQKLRHQKKLDQLGTEMVRVLEKVVEMGEQQRLNSATYALKLDNWENQLKFAVYVQDVLKTFKSGDLNLRFLMGKDHIMGSTHHLPLTFFNKNADFKEIVGEIGEIVVEPGLQDSTEKMILLIDAAYQKAVKMSPSLEERLVKAIFLLIVPSTEQIEDTNSLACEWMNEILTEEIQVSPDRKQLTLIERDYRFFVGWALRRCGDYVSSLQLLERAKKDYPDDPRFVHGLCLSEYCAYEDNASYSTEQKQKILERSLMNGQEAYSLYQTVEQTAIIIKTSYALLNTIAYVSAELYRVNPTENVPRIEQARTTLVQLKSKEPAYYKYPEYLHTEAHVELFEFRRLKMALEQDADNAELFEGALKKVTAALEVIDESIKGLEKKKLQRSIDKFNRLRLEIKTEREIFLNKYRRPK